MHVRKRSGFTLVELLVVITIIGMLMSLLLPAVNAAREAGRSNTCRVNQGNLALAMQSYEMSQGKYPGLINAVGLPDSSGNQRQASWVVMGFPHMERADIWRGWSQTVYVSPATSDPILSGTGPGAAFIPYLDILTCPSDSRSETANALAYVANAGWYDLSNSNPENDQNPANGVFFNHYLTSANGGRFTTVSADSLSNDGVTNTLMITENLQARTWSFPPVGFPSTSETGVEKHHFGFVWHGIQGAAANPTHTINGNLDEEVLDADHARPSSRHPGGVNVAFCDRRAQFMGETVDYTVYRQLMTSLSPRSDESNKVILDDSAY
ncbi:MAG: DUF1559 domain-containing protein [Pirellulales bacterium]